MLHSGGSLLSLLLLLSAQLPHLLVAQSSELRLQSSQFQQLLIFVEDHRGTQPSTVDLVRLVEAIKAGFENASRLLQSLTAGVGKPLNIGSVSILVSARLGQRLREAGVPVGDAQWQRRNRADFIVTHDASAAVEGAVAMEIGCGRPGKNVVMLSSSFTSDIHNILARKIALYFSQYRWGLLSEQPIGSPIETGPDGELRVSACSAKLNVRLVGADGSATCEFDVNSRRTSRGCAARLSDTQPDGPLASFMFAPFHRDVSRFCDGESRDPRLQHNRLVDSPMNRQCDGLSAAEVIRRHNDYSSTAEGAVPAAGPIAFSVVSEKHSRRVVVVMDVSGSMGGLSIARMISDVSLYLMELIEDGSECALISFTDTYQVLSDFVKIRSRRDRGHLSNLVSALVADGGTCIGGAVIAAANLLGRGYGLTSKSTTGQIILLSDGAEGCSEKLNNALLLVPQSSIEVVSIRYGDHADVRMDRLADVTGGRKFFGGTGLADINGLRLALSETTKELEESKRTLTLSSEEIGSRFVRRRFLVDESVKRDLVFRINVPTASGAVTQLQLVLTAPSGREFGYTDGSDIYKVDSAIGTITIRVPDELIQSGNWTLTDRATQSQPGIESTRSASNGGSIVVTGRSADDSIEAPVVLTAEVSPSAVSHVSEDTKIAVYARLLRGHAPILGAQLYATVRSNSRLVALVELADNGAGADLQANDGTYSAHLPVGQLNDPRDFAVSVSSVRPVSRVSSAGKVTVRSLNPSFDRERVPPAKVIDLSLTVNAMNRSASLKWTAVEDPTRPNSSAKYEIRFSSSHEQLLKSFSDCRILAVVSETSSISAGSAVQVDVFDQLADRGTVFLAVAGVSARNVSGPQSNLIEIDLKPPSESQLKHIGLVATEEGNDPRPEPGAGRFSIVGLLSGLAVSAAAAAGLAVLVKKLICVVNVAQPAGVESEGFPTAAKTAPDVRVAFANDYFDDPTVVIPTI